MLTRSLFTIFGPDFGALLSDRKSVEVQRGVQKLELTGKRTMQLRAGSETNLASAGKQNKRTSFRQSLAVCTERAQVGTKCSQVCSCQLSTIGLTFRLPFDSV